MPAPTALKAADIDARLGDLRTGWQVHGVHHLSKAWNFPNFADGLAFVNKVGALADRENHHPDVYLRWGRVRVEIWTHSIDGLSPADFALAGKIDAL